MNILFRCDGSVEIGMGHVVRCLALADHLKESHGCKIQFAMRRSELGINKVKESYPVMLSNKKYFNYKEWLTDCVEKTKANVLIMDMRDGLTREELKIIKKKTGIKVVTIDDPEDKRLETDLAFYPPVPQLEKLNWDEFEGELYVGWEYVILRKEFLHKYPLPKNTIPNIFVSMGATDENDMTAFILKILNEIDGEYFATFIIGSGYQYYEKLRKNLNVASFQNKLLKDPNNIVKIMSQVDFAIISFGQTAYELAALKIPANYICISNDHYNSSKLFVNEGIGISLGLFSSIKKDKLIKSIRLFLTNRKLVKKMSQNTDSLNVSDLDTISSLIDKLKLC